MKKFIIMVTALLLVAGFSVPGFAAKAKAKASAKKHERIVAEVVSVDTASNTMVVKREENGETRTVTISAKAASKVQVGDRVRIKLKAGTNESAGVRVLGARPVAGDDAAAGTDAKVDASVPVK